MSDDDSATAHAIRAIKAEGFAAGYDRAIANLLDRKKWQAWWVQQPNGVGSSVTDLADYLVAVKDQP